MRKLLSNDEIITSTTIIRGDNKSVGSLRQDAHFIFYPLLKICLYGIILIFLSQAPSYANHSHHTSFLTLTCTKNQDATDKNTSDGEVMIVLSSVMGTANFSLRNGDGLEISTFSLTGPTINTNISNLAADNYTLQATDAN